MTESLSIHQARKLVLLSQGLPPPRQSGAAIDTTLLAIKHLGYIQIDTISVVQRAHHHILWTRCPRYRSTQLDNLIADKKVFEYWSHAAAYLPMDDYRFSLPRMRAVASGDLEHWYKPDLKLMNAILKRIGDEGPLMARDFDNGGEKEKAGEWHHKPAKRALENLFMRGDLMIPRRENFHKIYDLTERVLPPGTNTTPPRPEEYARHLITRFLRANGLGLAREMAYLLKNTRPLVSATVQEMLSNKELLVVWVAGTEYYALPASLELLGRPLSRRKLKILSPFDNLLIQRKRTQALFGFDYLLECYTPESKRRHGYFSLPILWDGRLVARMDCKADRRHCRLHIHQLSIEPHVGDAEAFYKALSRELESFLHFNQCENVDISTVKLADTHLKAGLESALKPLTR